MPLWTPPQHLQHQHQRPTSSVLLQFPQWNYFFEKKGHKKSVAVWIVALGRCYFRHLLSPFIPFFPTICWRDSQTPRNPSESMRARPQCPLNALISNLRMFNGLECGIKKKGKDTMSVTWRKLLTGLNVKWCSTRICVAQMSNCTDSNVQIDWEEGWGAEEEHCGGPLTGKRYVVWTTVRVDGYWVGNWGIWLGNLLVITMVLWALGTLGQKQNTKGQAELWRC